MELEVQTDVRGCIERCKAEAERCRDSDDDDFLHVLQSVVTTKICETLQGGNAQISVWCNLENWHCGSISQKRTPFLSCLLAGLRRGLTALAQGTSAKLLDTYP